MRSLGLDPARLAAETGIPLEALSDPDLKVPAERVGRLLELAATRAAAPDFGLRLAETRRLSNLGPVGLIARDQPSLRKALEVMRQYQWLHNEAIALSVDETEDIAVLRLDFAGGPAAQAAELSVGVLCGNLRALMGPRWRPEAVMFRHLAPPDLARHRRLFGVAPEFGHDFDGLVIARRDLDAPLASADPGMANQVQRYVEQLAAGRRRAWRETVGDLIVLLLPTGACSADRVAEHLGFDRRTLHRRLAAEGCSFRDLMTERRAELAASLVAEGRGLSEVADLTGFASLSAFSHWFRAHFGRSASAFRAMRGGQGGLAQRVRG
ncbi:AraC family transcriptional regulator [Phenylobacterium montanum]|uniref:AraC family transcriptional regulator n=1 Tax=Phenylobacterium montanum TaxID=2823693 RepID=A0A975IWF9_9CAUL|nr:AraC family transcriptional regulator [Caulobacter sp. S6]QUD88351.1 AraC family transcriptional regulator [Caulobacter sp. S6]